MRRGALIAIPLIGAALILAGSVGQTGRADEPVSSWVWVAGPANDPVTLYSRTDSNGGLNLLSITSVDPGATGLTYAKITSGSCDSFPDEAVSLEGQLSLTGEGHYFAFMTPVGAPARAYAIAGGELDIGPYDSTLLPVPGHNLSAGFLGGPANTYFNVCLRKPGTFCVPYQGGLLCQAEYPSQGGTPTPSATATSLPVVNAPPSVTLPVVNAPPSVTLPVVNAPPTTGDWTVIGEATSDDAGAWRFQATVGQDLLAAGLTIARVSSGGCDTPIDQAVVFEAQLQATESEDRSWGGVLKPVGTPALALPAFDSSSGDTHFIPSSGGTLVDAALDGVLPDTLFTVCVRHP